NSPTTCSATTAEMPARKRSRRRRSPSSASGRSTPSRGTITSPRRCTCCRIEPPATSATNCRRLARSSDRDRGEADGLHKIEPVEVHDLVPGIDEVPHELVLRIVARIDLGQRAQLGVRPEDEV